MNADEARKLSNKKGFEKEVEEKISMIEKRIEKACSYGRTSTCAFAFYNDNEKNDIDREVKKHFIEQGFTFKPTGMNGGVMQTTEDICW